MTKASTHTRKGEISFAAISCFCKPYRRTRCPLPAGHHALLRIGRRRPDPVRPRKFFDVLFDWPVYLAPWVNEIAPGSAQDFMYLVGGVEILAGLAVALKPRYGAYLVAGWLGGIIVNLLSHSGYYDIALRDFGLLLGALALARLAAVYDPPLRRSVEVSTHGQG